MDRDEKKLVGFTGAIFVFFMVLVIAGWVAGSHFEAKAFERVTGKHVSTWDAMFITLRVQEPTSNER